MSETPRTDAQANLTGAGGPPTWHIHADFARQLERELAEARDQLAGAGKLMKACDVLVRDLAEARKQRDTLAEAAQAVVDRWDAPTWKDLEPTAKVMNALRNALAAVKGGSHE